MPADRSRAPRAGARPSPRILAVILAATAGPVGALASEPPPAGTIEPYELEAHGGEKVAAELGTFEVPRRRTPPAEPGETMELAFVRFPSTAAEPGPPIVYLAGGPGGSGISAARSARLPLFLALRQVADVIAFDQRGTGLSSVPEHEDCEVTRPRPADRPLDHPTLIELTLDATRECGAWWREHGIDLAAYDTLESADDVDALRRFLGAEKITLWGISYGTHLALAIVRRHPRTVHRAILAGVEGPDHTVKLPGQWERQLDRLERLIAADPAARRRFPELRPTMRSLLERLERGPITLEYVPPDGPPDGSPDEPPDGGRAERVVVGRPELERLTISMLRDPTTLVSVPTLYARIAAGDFADLRESPEVRFEMEAMGEAMDAASGMSPARRRRFQREARETLLGGGAGVANAGAAEALGVPDLGDDFRSPVRSPVPTLFISGTLDGRTPLENAEEVIAGFPNGEHLVIGNAGHSDDLFLSSPRILETMLAFLRGEPLPPLEIEVEPPSFADVRQRVPLPPAAGRRYLGEYRRDDGELWRVIPTGIWRTLDAEGQVVAEELGIQVRFGGNGYTLVPVGEDTFYIPLPWLEEIDFTFVTGGEGRVERLEFTDSRGERQRLHRVEAAQ